MVEELSAYVHIWKNFKCFLFLYSQSNHDKNISFYVFFLQFLVSNKNKIKNERKRDLFSCSPYLMSLVLNAIYCWVAVCVIQLYVMYTIIAKTDNVICCCIYSIFFPLILLQAYWNVYEYWSVVCLLFEHKK